MKARTIRFIVMASLASAMVIQTVVKGDIHPVYGIEPIIYPPPGDAFRRMNPRPPCWTAWWEANRDPYLELIRQGTHSDDAQSASSPNPYYKVTRQGIDQKSDQEALEKYRKQATESLLSALKSDSGRVRGSAALALGQIGAAEALDPLSKLAKKDKAVQVRQAAIIAIGLLDTPKGEEILSDMAFRPLPRFKNGFSDKPNDRQAALTALGLMSRLSPATTVGLQKMVRQSLVASPILAWALTRPLDPADPVAPKLYQGAGINSQKQRLAEGSGLAASAISVWAMSGRESPANSKMLKYALTKTNVPWIAGEAMLSLGSRGRTKSAAGLSEVLLATPRGKALPVYKMLQDQDDRLMYLWKVRKSRIVCQDIRKAHKTKLVAIRRGETGPAAVRSYCAAFLKAIGGETTTRRTRGHVWGHYPLRYLQLHYSGENYGAVRYKGRTIRDYHWMGLWGKNEKARALVYHINLGVEPIFQADLRASAAIALGRIDTPVSRSALRKVLEKKDDEYSDAYKSMAIMSLGQLGDADALPALVELLRPTAPRGVVIPKERLQTPLRGFAALALGLYARPVKASQGVVNRKGYDKVCLLLAKRLADVKEQQDFRAACALALGLSGRTENLKYLQAVSKTVDGRDDLLIGYVILSRGMLGDKTILEPAKAFLTVANNKTDRNGILGRRAAVLGVGLTRSRKAIPLLANCWDLSYHVDREMALAMSFCRGFEATERLVAVMNGTTKPKAKALAGRCLGELFMKERPSRLARLSNGSNYMMRTPRLTSYRAMANEFLYTYLLAPSTDEWKTLGAD